MHGIRLALYYKWQKAWHVEDKGMIRNIKVEVQRRGEKTGLSLSGILRELGIGRSMYYVGRIGENLRKRGLGTAKLLKKEGEAVWGYIWGHVGVG